MVKLTIQEHKIIAIMRRVPSDKLIPVTQALYDGGIRLLEITFDHSDPDTLVNTGKALKMISEAFAGKISLGAGTVLTAQQVEIARDKGASFIVSPNTDADVIRRSIDLDMLSIPGAFTPSEVVHACSLGAGFVKLFPGGELGPGYIRALSAPLSHIPILVVGGVNLGNMQEFLQAGAAGFGIGNNIVDKNLIAGSSYAELSKLARKYTKSAE